MSGAKVVITLAIMLMVAIDFLVVVYLLRCIRKGVKDGVANRDKKWLISVIGKRSYYFLIAYCVIQFFIIVFYRFMK